MTIQEIINELMTGQVSVSTVLDYHKKAMIFEQSLLGW